MNLNIIEKYWNPLKGLVHALIPHAVILHGVILKAECVTEEKMMSRRVVLRGALAVGCGLMLPTIFSGCDSKKSADSTSSVPDSPHPSPSVSSSDSAVAAKATQASVQYQSNPKADQKCSGCINFSSDSNTCKLVEGQISPDGWCILWAKKA